MTEYYICENCGVVVREDELREEECYEDRGECWGSPCSERMVYLHCPNCGSEDVEPYDETEDFLDEEDF